MSLTGAVRIEPSSRDDGGVAGIPAELLVGVQSFAVVNMAPVWAMIAALRTAAGARCV